MRIGIINNSKHKTPLYKTPGSSGVDICANLDQDVLAFQKSKIAGSWVGFSLFFLLIMLISWGVA